MSVKIKGHCIIRDENGKVVFDGYNDVHPGNMARMISRGLSNESSYWINSIRFGNLGTYGIDHMDTKLNKTITTYVHRSPNDGIDPDYSGWKSDLYNEIYREYIDDHYVSTVSTGKNADASLDPISIEHNLDGVGVVSVDENFKSKVVVNCCLNMNEPSRQMLDGGVFKFDEIALYSGYSSSAWSGYQLVNVGSNYNAEDTGLLLDTEYCFDIMIGSQVRNIVIKTPKIGTGNDGKISYYDLLLLLNNSFTDVTIDII